MLKVARRECAKKYAAFNLRKAGRIPGIVYGKGMAENVPVSLDIKEFRAVLATGKRLVDLDLDGQPMKALIKAVQHGTFDTEILHADFRATQADELIEVELPIELEGVAAGQAVGGMIEQSLHSIHVKCVPAKLPDRIVLNVAKLELNGLLHVSDLPALDGVSYTAHGDPAVAACRPPRAAAEPESATSSEASSAPEVIGEKEREAKAAEKDKDKDKDKKA